MKDGVRFSATEQELKASYQLRYKVYVEHMGRFKDMGDHELKELRDSEMWQSGKTVRSLRPENQAK